MRPLPCNPRAREVSDILRSIHSPAVDKGLHGRVQEAAVAQVHEAPWREQLECLRVWSVGPKKDERLEDTVPADGRGEGCRQPRGFPPSARISCTHLLRSAAPADPPARRPPAASPHAIMVHDSPPPPPAGKGGHGRLKTSRPLAAVAPLTCGLGSSAATSSSKLPNTNLVITNGTYVHGCPRGRPKRGGSSVRAAGSELDESAGPPVANERKGRRSLGSSASCALGRLWWARPLGSNAAPHEPRLPRPGAPSWHSFLQFGRCIVD